MTREELNEALMGLVQKGLVEMYLDKDGEFCFGLTEEKRTILQQLLEEEEE